VRDAGPPQTVAEHQLQSGTVFTVHLRSSRWFLLTLLGGHQPRWLRATPSFFILTRQLQAVNDGRRRELLPNVRTLKQRFEGRDQPNQRPGDSAV
jgi:hypothetical protein